MTPPDQALQKRLRHEVWNHDLRWSFRAECLEPGCGYGRTCAGHNQARHHSAMTGHPVQVTYDSTEVYTTSHRRPSGTTPQGPTPVHDKVVQGQGEWIPAGAAHQPEAALFVGGPLDGRQYRGRSMPLYRDDEGNPIKADRGDRQWVRRTGGPTRFYARQGRGGRLYYVHATARDTWQDHHQTSNTKRQEGER